MLNEITDLLILSQIMNGNHAKSSKTNAQSTLLQWLSLGKSTPAEATVALNGPIALWTEF